MSENTAQMKMCNWHSMYNLENKTSETVIMQSSPSDSVLRLWRKWIISSSWRTVCNAL